MERLNRNAGMGISLCILCLVILAGCATSIEISAYAQPGSVVNKRFALQGPDPGLPGGDPAWPRYAQILSRALEVKGFVPDTTSPDLVIRVSYSVSGTVSDSTGTSSLYTIQVEALDAASLAAGKPAVLWRTHARQRGGYGMDRMFPIMVSAMEDYFGVSLDAFVDVSMPFDDPEAARLEKR